jgi:hypothetical protein
LKKREKRFGVTKGCGSAFRDNKSDSNLAFSKRLLEAETNDKLRVPASPKKVHLMMRVTLKLERQTKRKASGRSVSYKSADRQKPRK